MSIRVVNFAGAASVANALETSVLASSFACDSSSSVKYSRHDRGVDLGRPVKSCCAVGASDASQCHIVFQGHCLAFQQVVFWFNTFRRTLGRPTAFVRVIWDMYIGPWILVEVHVRYVVFFSE